MSDLATIHDHVRAEVDRDGLGVLVMTNYDSANAVAVGRADAAFDMACENAGVDLSLHRMTAPTPVKAFQRLIQYGTGLPTGHKWTKVSSGTPSLSSGGTIVAQLDFCRVNEHREEGEWETIGKLHFEIAGAGSGGAWQIWGEGLPDVMVRSLVNGHERYRTHFMPNDFTNLLKQVGKSLCAVRLRKTGGAYFWHAGVAAEATAMIETVRMAMSSVDAINTINVGRGTGDRRTVTSAVGASIVGSLENLQKELDEFSDEMSKEGGAVPRPATFQARIAKIEEARQLAATYEKLLDIKLTDHRANLGAMESAYEAFLGLANMATGNAAFF